MEKKNRLILKQFFFYSFCFFLFKQRQQSASTTAEHIRENWFTPLDVSTQVFIASNTVNTIFQTYYLWYFFFTDELASHPCCKLTGFFVKTLQGFVSWLLPVWRIAAATAGSVSYGWRRLALLAYYQKTRFVTKYNYRTLRHYLWRRLQRKQRLLLLRRQNFFFQKRYRLLRERRLHLSHIFAWRTKRFLTATCHRLKFDRIFSHEFLRWRAYLCRTSVTKRRRSHLLMYSFLLKHRRAFVFRYRQKMGRFSAPALSGFFTRRIRTILYNPRYKCFAYRRRRIFPLFPRARRRPNVGRRRYQQGYFVRRRGRRVVYRNVSRIRRLFFSAIQASTSPLLVSLPGFMLNRKSLIFRRRIPGKIWWQRKLYYAKRPLHIRWYKNSKKEYRLFQKLQKVANTSRIRFFRTRRFLFTRIKRRKRVRRYLLRKYYKQMYVRDRFRVYQNTRKFQRLLHRKKRLRVLFEFLYPAVKSRYMRRPLSFPRRRKRRRWVRAKQRYVYTSSRTVKVKRLQRAARKRRFVRKLYKYQRRIFRHHRDSKALNIQRYSEYRRIRHRVRYGPHASSRNPRGLKLRHGSIRRSYLKRSRFGLNLFRSGKSRFGILRRVTDFSFYPRYLLGLFQRFKKRARKRRSKLRLCVTKNYLLKRAAVEQQQRYLTYRYSRWREGHYPKYNRLRYYTMWRRTRKFGRYRRWICSFFVRPGKRAFRFEKKQPMAVDFLYRVRALTKNHTFFRVVRLAQLRNRRKMKRLSSNFKRRYRSRMRFLQDQLEDSRKKQKNLRRRMKLKAMLLKTKVRIRSRKPKLKKKLTAQDILELKKRVFFAVRKKRRRLLYEQSRYGFKILLAKKRFSKRYLAKREILQSLFRTGHFWGFPRSHRLVTRCWLAKARPFSLGAHYLYNQPVLLSPRRVPYLTNTANYLRFLRIARRRRPLARRLQRFKRVHRKFRKLSLKLRRRKVRYALRKRTRKLRFQLFRKLRRSYFRRRHFNTLRKYAFRQKVRRFWLKLLFKRLRFVTFLKLRYSQIIKRMQLARLQPRVAVDKTKTEKKRRALQLPRNRRKVYRRRLRALPAISGSVSNCWENYFSFYFNKIRRHSSPARRRRFLKRLNRYYFSVQLKMKKTQRKKGRWALLKASFLKSYLRRKQFVTRRFLVSRLAKFTKLYRRHFRGRFFTRLRNLLNVVMRRRVNYNSSILQAMVNKKKIRSLLIFTNLQHHHTKFVTVASNVDQPSFRWPGYQNLRVSRYFVPRGHKLVKAHGLLTMRYPSVKDFETFNFLFSSSFLYTRFMLAGCGLTSQKFVLSVLRYLRPYSSFHLVRFLDRFLVSGFPIYFELSSLKRSNKEQPFPVPIKWGFFKNYMLKTLVTRFRAKRHGVSFQAALLTELWSWHVDPALSILHDFLVNHYAIGMDSRFFVHYRWRVKR